MPNYRNGIKMLLSLMILGCLESKIQEKKNDTVQQQKNNQSMMSVNDIFFNYAKDFPFISDTAKFISYLQKTFELKIDRSPVQEENEKISFYNKVKFYGSNKYFYFIEYDYTVGSMASFPWKYQIILTEDGKLVKAIAAKRFEFIKVFPNQNPFLLAVIVTAKGNGGHELYQIINDSLENVYEGYYDYAVRTYDAHQDNKVYKPNELSLQIQDCNKDGINDLIFKGELLFIEGVSKDGIWFNRKYVNGEYIDYSVNNPFKKIPINLIFLYNKKTKHFKAKEDYVKKYKLLK